MGYEPENTLSSFRKALELGADWIETDVYAVDGELVLIHDDRLDRTTNGTGTVTQSSLEYLRSLDAGKGQQIPLLSEALELIDASAGLNIELKGAGTASLVARSIQESLLGSKWREDQFIVSSFDHPELLAFSILMPEIRIGALTAGIPLGYAGFAESLNAWSVHASIEFVNREFVADAHERGKKIFVYTVNHPDDFARLRRIGVDGVFTDYPDRCFATG
jgi:glycerophosphoryl diester phosphodiesterase